MDIKSFQPSKRKPKPRKIKIGPSLKNNEMFLRTSWTATSITSGTSGTMSSWTSPTIYAASEYTVLQSLFTEVKLVKATFILTPTQATNGSVLHGALVIGTNMLENQNTAVSPTGYGDVQNLTRFKRVSSSDVRPVNYNFPVPNGLQYAAITADAPNPATPWAGSPGAFKWYASGFTASTVYFNLHVDCLYHLRGRQ
jgi:hypothetical protein